MKMDDSKLFWKFHLLHSSNVPMDEKANAKITADIVKMDIKEM